MLFRVEGFKAADKVSMQTKPMRSVGATITGYTTIHVPAGIHSSIHATRKLGGLL